MSLLEMGMPVKKHHFIRQRAHMYNANIDTILSPDKEAKKATLEHLQDCIKSPTIGLMARKEAETKYYSSEKRDYNKHVIFDNKEVQKYNDMFEKKYNELYPKTGELRKDLIEKGRVVFKKVMPKMGKIKKIFSFL